jgi:hypothetical protein
VIDILSDEFALQAAAAGNRARLDVLAHGVRVFYLDRRSGLEIMQQPDRRRFEIRFIPNSSGEQNYEVIREIAGRPRSLCQPPRELSAWRMLTCCFGHPLSHHR